MTKAAKYMQQWRKRHPNYHRQWYQRTASKERLTVGGRDTVTILGVRVRVNLMESK